MQSVMSSEFKRAMVIMLDGVPQIIEEFHAAGTAQTRHRLHVRLRNLKTGRLTERTFGDNERYPVAALSRRRVQFSYKQADSCIFTDDETFEEFELSNEQIGDRMGFIKENMEGTAMILDGKLLDIDFPSQVALRVVETGPSQRGGSEASWKEARLETGLEIMVPLFIAKDDVVRVDTATKKYLGKDNS
jgi:elongation factor P